MNACVNVAWVWMALISMQAFAQNDPEEFRAFLDVFEFESVEHVVVAHGEGYFPVLNQVGGDLVSVYRRGAGYWGRDGHLVMRWSFTGGLSWTPAALVVNSRQDDRNPAVGVTPDGRLVAAYFEVGGDAPARQSNAASAQGRCMVVSESLEDEGWSAPRPLGIAGLERAVPFGRIQSTAEGVLLLAVRAPYTRHIPGLRDVRDDARNYACLVRSYDGGETWEDPSLIAPGHGETALFALSGDRLLAAARSDHSQQINLFRSEDGGREWSSPLRLTDGMQSPGDFIELANGWLLLLYGDHSQEFKTVQGIVSRDGGRSWELQLVAVFSRPLPGDMGHPSGVRLPDGRIAIQYDWAGHARIRSDDFDGGEARLYMTLIDEDEFIQAYDGQVVEASKP